MPTNKRPARLHGSCGQRGITLVEVLMTLAIGSVLIVSINGIVGQGLQTQSVIQSKNELTNQANMAMQMMVRAVSRTRGLRIPSAENPNTAWPESVREFPARAAWPGETAVLAVLLDPQRDLNDDGFADSDNDLDGKIDEDPGGDSTNDLAAGIYGIDDDNDGTIDEEHTGNGPLFEDDDEDGVANEDLVDGIDNDGDGKYDEDIKKQMDGDDLSGIGGVDDNGNGQVDEGDKNDDDEDGSVDEDWYDIELFRMQGNSLMHRAAVPVDVAAPGGVNGRDYLEFSIADNVTRFRVERLQPDNSGTALVDLTLELADPATGESIRLNTQVRVGGAL